MRLYTLRALARRALSKTMVILSVSLLIYEYRSVADDSRHPAAPISGFYGPGSWLACCISALNIAVICKRGQEGDGLSDIIAVGGYTAIACIDMLLHLPHVTSKKNRIDGCLSLSSSLVKTLSRFAAAKSVVNGGRLIFTTGMAWSLCNAFEQGWQNFPSTRSTSFIAGSIVFQSVSIVGDVSNILSWEHMWCRPGVTKLHIHLSGLYGFSGYVFPFWLFMEVVLAAIGYWLCRLKFGIEEENWSGMFFRAGNGTVLCGTIVSLFLLVPGVGFPLSQVPLTDLDQFAALISVCVLTIGRLCIWWIYRPADLSRGREAWRIGSDFRPIRM